MNDLPGRGDVNPYGIPVANPHEIEGPDEEELSELDKFVEQATGHRETALELLNDPRADIVAAQEAQVHATLYLADMVAAVFATLPRDADD